MVSDSDQGSLTWLESFGNATGSSFPVTSFLALFLILAKDKQALLSLEKVDSIVLATGVHLSNDVIRLAIEHHIDIVLLDGVGEPYERFWRGRPGSTAALRRAQLEASFREDGDLLAR